MRMKKGTKFAEEGSSVGTREVGIGKLGAAGAQGKALDFSRISEEEVREGKKAVKACKWKPTYRIPDS